MTLDDSVLGAVLHDANAGIGGGAREVQWIGFALVHDRIDATQ